MLQHLTIRDFVLVSAIEIGFARGLTVITGETGAGKSILLDALGLVLGDRGRTDLVRHGAASAEVTATFELADDSPTRAWLAEQNLLDPDQPHSCLVRRTLTAEGRSRAFINSTPVTLALLRALGEQLVDVHAQHEFQALQRGDTQLAFIDAFAGSAPELERVRNHYRAWQAAVAELDAAGSDADARAARRQLLRYQADELEQLAPQDGEFNTLLAEQRLLERADELGDLVLRAITAIDDDDGLGSRTAGLARQLEAVADVHPGLATAAELLRSASVHFDEARPELDRAAAAVRRDPRRLAQVATRIDALWDIARKHRIDPGDLPDLHQRILAELAGREADEDRLRAATATAEREQAAWQRAAEALSKRRRQAAARFSADVSAQLQVLEMTGARLAVEFSPTVSERGIDNVEYRVATRVDMLPASLGRVASGGELSRISLAIDVVAAEHTSIPCVVLDEADVGIGGATAAIVGDLLARLGTRAQVICVTHLAQVAARGHNHLRVARDNATGTRVALLDRDARIEEIARMVGGARITARTRAHAEEMLTSG